MTEAGFEYSPQPFTDTAVQTITTERTRELVAEHGWEVIPTNPTPHELEPESTDPNDVYYRSLSASVQAQYQVALNGQGPDDPYAEPVLADMGCFGRASDQQQQTSP